MIRQIFRPGAFALATMLALASNAPAVAQSSFVLSTDAFANNTPMPQRFAFNGDHCGGTNVVPVLHLSGAPRATRSFALVMHDPDAPVAGGWYHWIAYDIPAGTRTIDAHSGTGGRNSFGTRVYGGPCPPPGPAHHYHFTAYALDTRLTPSGSSAPLTGPQVEQRVHGHVLAQTTLTGLYQH